MRASMEPVLHQPVLVGVFDRVEGLKACLDALRAEGIPPEGLTLLAHEQKAPGTTATSAESSTALAHQALIGGVLRDYLAPWGGLALISIPGFGPTVVAGGARAVVAEQLAAALTAPEEGDPLRLGVLDALTAGNWLLVAHGDDELLKAAERCFLRREAIRVVHLLA